MITDTESAMDATATGLGNYLNELMGMYQRILEHYDERLNVLYSQQQQGQQRAEVLWEETSFIETRKFYKNRRNYVYKSKESLQKWTTFI